MFDRFKSMVSRIAPAPTPAQVDLDQIAPDGPILVLGDIHGSYDLLRDKLVELDAYVTQNARVLGTSPQLVFVGDYVDRGEHSAQVLEWVFGLANQMPGIVTCLMGNHERMMIDFLDDPAGRGVRWLRNGGLQTLASYKVGGVRERSDVEELTAASLALEAALPDGLLEWLRALPLSFQTGNVCVVHAAMDPHLGLADQVSNSLLWGHNEFMSRDREDGLWVVHGHTIVKEPEIRKSRISIDTGAYHTGKLTAAAISPGQCIFI
ncbi:MAG: metallophosphoesterase [Sulfitobacter sp.]